MSQISFNHFENSCIHLFIIFMFPSGANFSVQYTNAFQKLNQKYLSFIGSSHVNVYLEGNRFYVPCIAFPTQKHSHTCNMENFTWNNEIPGSYRELLILSSISF